MNYLKIVLDGYFNKNRRNHLDSYFYRKLKEAENKHIDTIEFISGCLKIIEKFEVDINKHADNHKNELHLMIDKAQNRLLTYPENNKTLKKNNKETIEYCKSELSEINKDNFPVHLGKYTNGQINYNMHNNEVLYIKNAILKAYQKTKNETKNKTKN